MSQPQIESHLAALDAAETERDRLKRVTAQTLARIYDEADPVADVVESHRQTLEASQREAISEGKLELAHRALDVFINSVRAALLFERTHGRLRQYTSFDRVNAWKGELAAHSWGAAEKSTLVDFLIRPADEIAAVGWHAITLADGRLITRDIVRANCRREIFGSLISDERLAVAEEDTAAPRKTMGDGSGITDASGRFTPFHSGEEA